MSLEVLNMNLKRLVSTITASAISLLASSHVVMAAAVEEVQQHQEVFRDYSQDAPTEYTRFNNITHRDGNRAKQDDDL